MRLFLVLTAACLLTRPAAADEVRLKDGRVLTGIVLAQDERQVVLRGGDGLVVLVPRKDVDSIQEGFATGDHVIDARIAAAGTDDPERLLELVREARREKRDGWRTLAQLAARAHPAHEGLHRALGRRPAGGGWRPASWETRDVEEAAPAGMVRHRGGFIRAEDKARAVKEPKDFELDEEGVWRTKEEILAAKGYVFINGHWIKGGSPEDPAAMERFKGLLGSEIWVRSSPRFRLFVQGMGPDEIEPLLELCDRSYAWFLAEMRQPADKDLFRGQRLHLWILKDEPTFGDWLKHYAAEYKLAAADVAFFARIHKAAGLLVAARERRQDPSVIPNWIANYLGHFFLTWLSNPTKSPPPWLAQAWGHLVQHYQCGDIPVSFVDRARYGDQGGRTDKLMRTLAVAEERARELVLQGLDEPLETMDRLEYNALTLDHMAKGVSLLNWLFTEHRESLIRWTEQGGAKGFLATVPDVFPGWDAAAMDGAWRARMRGGR